MSELRFDGRVALVTGAGRGLGRAYAEALAARGASVVVNDPGGALDGSGSDQGPANEVVEAIVRSGGKAVANFDRIGTFDAGLRMVDQAVSTFGRIDIIINNAGNFAVPHTFPETTDEGFLDLFMVHVMGAVHTTRAAWPYMAGQGYGKIINTGSSVAFAGTRNRLEYGTAKGALYGLTKCLAQESLDSGIYVNMIAPGALTRPGLDRAGGKPPESLKISFAPGLVTPAVLWLAHEECKTNGQAITSVAGATTRVAVGETAGFESDSPTVEDIRDRWEQVLGESDLGASKLSFWDNAETQGLAMIGRFGNRLAQV